MDEPLGALDLKMREHMQIELRRIQQQLGLTAIYVTHDQVEAMTMSDRIAVMNGGRIEQLGTPEEIYNAPCTRFVANFVGRVNFLDGSLTHRDQRFAAIETDCGMLLCESARESVGAAITIAVRPEHLTLLPPRSDADGMNVLGGRIASETFCGSVRQYVVELAGRNTFLVETNPREFAGSRETKSALHGGRATASSWRTHDSGTSVPRLPNLRQGSALMASPVNRGTVEWSGENPGIYLKDADGAWQALAVFFKVVTSPFGRGSGRNRPRRTGERDGISGGPQLCLSNNEPLMRWLVERYVSNFASFRNAAATERHVLSARGIVGDRRRRPDVSPGVAWRRGLGRRAALGGSRAAFRRGRRAIDVSDGKAPDVQRIRRGERGIISVNGSRMRGQIIQRDFLDRRMSTAFLAFSETWIAPAD